MQPPFLGNVAGHAEKDDDAILGGIAGDIEPPSEAEATSEVDGFRAGSEAAREPREWKVCLGYLVKVESKLCVCRQ